MAALLKVCLYEMRNEDDEARAIQGTMDEDMSYRMLTECT